MDLSSLLGDNKTQTEEPVAPPPPPADPVPPVSQPVMPEPVVPEPPMPQPLVPPVIPVPEPVMPPPAMPPQVPPEPVAPPAPPVPTVLPVTPPEPVKTAAVTPPTAGPMGEVFEGKGKGKYRVVVLKDKCIGAASCIAVSPKTFELNDQQIAKVLPTVVEETDENLLLAAQSCPTLAIEVYDTTTGEKVWPK